MDPIAFYDREGAHPYENEDPDGIATVNRVIWTGSSHRASGGDPYNGKLADRVFFGDMCVGFVRMLELDQAGAVVSDQHFAHVPHVSSIDQGPAGFMYVSTYGACATTPTIVPEPSKLCLLYTSPSPRDS